MDKPLSNKKDIKKWLDRHKIKNYTLNENLVVDVNGDVNISNRNLEIIPVEFRNVSGDFLCQNNKLISLSGAPEFVGGIFLVHVNQITDLVCSPKIVNGYFDCSNNRLTSLAGAPKSVGGGFYCYGNWLRSLFELVNCKFNGEIVFNIDENNFKQKNLIQILKKYYRGGSVRGYVLNYNELLDIIKPQIEKEILDQKLNSSKIKNQIKTSFL